MLFAYPYCSTPAPYRWQTRMQANRNKWTAQCVAVPSDFNYSYKRAVKRWCYLRRFIVCYTRRANYANAFGLLVQPRRYSESHNVRAEMRRNTALCVTAWRLWEQEVTETRLLSSLWLLFGPVHIRANPDDETYSYSLTQLPGHSYL